MIRKNKTISAPTLIVVEGLDYLHFLRNRIKNDANYDSVQLWDFKEGTSLRDNLGLLRAEREFTDRVRGVGIICDAEASRAAMKDSVRAALADNGFAASANEMELVESTPRTAFLIIPHDEEAGCLEHACLKASRRSEQLPCVDAFFECVRSMHAEPLNYNYQAKLKVHAHIAGSGLKPSLTLGESAEANLWNFDHPSLEVMLRLIRLVRD